MNVIDFKGNKIVAKRKEKMISMRITQRQFDYLDKMARRIRSSTGFKITRASIILKLMEYGLPYLEKEFPSSLDESNPPEEFKTPTAS